MGTHSATAGEGAPAPDFELPDQEGRPFRLSGALADGPVVLVFLRGFA
jgi:peroxiredoxin